MNANQNCYHMPNIWNENNRGTKSYCPWTVTGSQPLFQATPVTPLWTWKQNRSLRNRWSTLSEINEPFSFISFSFFFKHLKGIIKQINTVDESAACPRSLVPNPDLATLDVNAIPACSAMCGLVLCITICGLVKGRKTIINIRVRKAIRLENGKMNTIKFNIVFEI